MYKNIFFLFLCCMFYGQNQGIWVTRFALKNESTLSNLVTFSKKNGITDVFIQVRGRADAYYLSHVEKNIKVESDLPLTKVLEKLKKNNIRVHAWINVFLLASSQEIVEKESQHILNKNPNWIDFKKDLEAFSTQLETTEKLKEYRDVEGIYTLPIFNDVLTYYKEITEELITKYKFDGIHFDYFRLAGSKYGFHPKMRRFFHEETGIYIEKHMNNSHMEPEIQEKWSNFISSKYTFFLSEITKMNTEILWSVAVKPNPYDAKYVYGQDWKSWLENDIVDFVLPMNYSRSNYNFGKNIDYYLEDDIRDKIWVGIATFNQNESEIISKINFVKQKNLHFTLFSFNDLDEKSIKQILR